MERNVPEPRELGNGELGSAMTEIRPAAPADAADIARLILLSAEDFLPAVFGGGVEDALCRLAGGRATLFSYRHALVARERERTVGMVLGYAGSEKAAEDVGFYYAANASGRLLGTLLSGLLYQLGGITGCLVGSAAMLALCWFITLLLPASVNEPVIAHQAA